MRHLPGPRGPGARARGQRLRWFDPGANAPRSHLPRPRLAPGRRGRGHGPTLSHGRVRRPIGDGLRRAPKRSRSHRGEERRGARHPHPGRSAGVPGTPRTHEGLTRGPGLPRVLGVDVSLGRGLDVVLLEDTVVKETWTRMGPRALTELLWAHRPDAVAIDSPPSPGLGLLRDDTERSRLSVPPPAGKHLARRV